MNNQERYAQITQRLQTLRSQYDQAQGQLTATLGSIGAATLADAERMLAEAQAAEQAAAATFEGLLSDYESRYPEAQG